MSSKQFHKTLTDNNSTQKSMLTVKELLRPQISTTTSITHTILFLTTQHDKIRTEGSNEKIKSYKTDTQQILVPLPIKFVHTSQSPFLWGFRFSIQFLTSTPLPPSQFAIKLNVLSPQRIFLSFSLPFSTYLSPSATYTDGQCMPMRLLFSSHFRPHM